MSIARKNILSTIPAALENLKSTIQSWANGRFSLTGHTHTASQITNLSGIGFPNYNAAGGIASVYPVSNGASYTSPGYNSYLVLVFDMPQTGAEGHFPIKIKISGKSILAGVASRTSHWYDHGSSGMMIPLEASTTWTVEDGRGCLMYYQYIKMK